MAHEYIKENDTFNTSKNGTVPKPTQAEVEAGKVLKADGTWGEGGGGGGSDGVLDVTVDGVSVVDEDRVAEIDLTGKQDVLTAGDRISISQDTISANIAPFSIVDGKMCITYKGEVE